MEASDKLTAAEVLGPDGLIARRLSHYELRPQQLAMADAVTDAIRRRKEAPSRGHLPPTT